MKEDNTLDTAMLAALATEQYCKENNHKIWEIDSSGVEHYTFVAQAYFTATLYNKQINERFK